MRHPLESVDVPPHQGEHPNVPHRGQRAGWLPGKGILWRSALGEWVLLELEYSLKDRQSAAESWGERPADPTIIETMSFKDRSDVSAGK